MCHILHYNINSLLKHQLELQQYLEETNPDVLCLNETKLGSRPAPNIPGYHLLSRVDRLGHSHGGGVAIYAKPHLQAVEIDVDQIDCCAIRLPNQKLTIVSNYWGFAPSVKPSVDHLQRIFSKETIFLGDFNAHHRDWGFKDTNPRGRLLYNFIDINDMCILNSPDEPTWINTTNNYTATLDVAFTSLENVHRIRTCYAGRETSGIAAFHLPLHVVVKGTSRPIAPRGSVGMVQQYNISKCDWPRYQEELSNTEVLPSTHSVSKASINQSVSQITDDITRAFDLSCPKRSQRPNTFRVSQNTLDLIKSKRETLRNLRLFPDTPELKTLFHQQAKQVRRAIHSEREEKFCRDTSDLHPNNSRKFWQKVKQLNTDLNNTAQTGAPTLLKEDGTKTRNAEETANRFATNLQKIHQVHTDANFDADYKQEIDDWVEANPDLFTPDFSHPPPAEHNTTKYVTTFELKQVLREARKKSAPGEDQITYTKLMMLPDSYLTKVAALMSTCIRTGYFPDDWKSAIGKMLPKPNKDGSNPSSYRPISLISCLGKTFEKVLASRLMSHLNDIDFINQWQRAYLKKKEGTEHLHYLSEQLKRAAAKKWSTYVLLLDVEKAFDSVWQNGLRKKLHKLGLPGQFLQLLSSFLTDRTIKIKVGNVLSNYVHLSAGTPQGSALSPILFIIYVNDIPINNGTNTSQFADDLGLIIHNKNAKFIKRQMQRQLDALESWCNKWHVKLNAGKTVLLTFPKHTVTLTLYGIVIKPASTGKLLGVTLDNRRTWEQHIDDLVRRSTQRLNLLRRLRGWGASYHTMRTIYTSYIRPLLETGYHFTIYATKTRLNKLQVVQNEALRLMLRLPRYTRISTLHEEAHLPTIKEHLLQLHERAIQRYGDSKLRETHLLQLAIIG